MERPKIKVKMRMIDYVVEIFALVGIVLLIGVAIFYHNQLDILPRHFNAFGKPDSFGSRGTIWILPIVGLILYSGLTILNKFPHLFNFPVAITNENVERLYLLSIRMIRLIKLIIVFAFLYINIMIIRVGLHKSVGLNPLFLVIFLTLIIGLIVFTISKMNRKMK